MKKLLMICLTCLLSMGLFAQQTENEDEIELPEVTTVISGSSMKAGKDSVPDYRKIIPDEKTAGIQLPELDGNKTPDNGGVNYSRESSQEKNIYAEGQAGGGYPFYFLGDFSIYRATGNSPFAIDFKHESVEGFADKDAENGYFTRDTSISARKAFNSAKGRHSLAGSYKTSDDGLQSASSKMNDQVKHTISFDGSSLWKFDNGMSLSYGAESNWYNRYSGLYKDCVVDDADTVQSETSVFYAAPFFGVGYSKGSFGMNFKMSYALQLNLGEDDSFIKPEGSSSEYSSHRGKFEIGTKWEVPLVTLYANAAAVVGTAIGSENVIVPFTLGTDWRINAFASERLLVVKVEGGLSSYQETVQNLENKYKYSFASCIPVETTDWYGKAAASIPLKDVLTIGGLCEFRKTAFENGVWSADYDGTKTSEYALYVMTPEEMTQFNTAASVEFSWKNFKFTGLWDAYWKDVPALKDKQNITATALYQGPDARWNALGYAAFGLGEDADAVPDLGFNAAYRVSPSIRLALEVNDIVKLFTAETRDYGHSSYAQKSGNVALLVKFQF